MRPAPEATVYYTIESDIWLVGITTLQLSYRVNVLNNEFLERMIKYGQEIMPEDGQNFSRTSRDMVAMCLDPDPSRRPEPEELLSHGCVFTKFVYSHL